MSLARALVALLCILLPLAAQTKRTWTDAEVMKIHNSALLIDGHNDVPSDTVDGLDLGPRRASGHTDIPRMKQGGVAAQFFVAYVAPTHINKGTSAHRALQMIDSIRTSIIARHPETFTLATTAADILRARKSGRIAALIAIEGGHAIENDLGLLRAYYDLGVRYMTLTHTKDVGWAGSSADPANTGLTDFGRQVIAEMNRLGMMIDIAHVSDKTFWDVIAASRAPVFSSHSSARAISNVARNLSDDMLRAVAKSGGLVMVNFCCEFLSQKSADTSAWLNPAIAEAARTATAHISDPKARQKAIDAFLDARLHQASIDDVVAHIVHIRAVAGVDHIGLGSDFDGITCVPKGLEDVSKWPALTRKLLEAGFTPAEIRKIYGDNLLRFMRAVETTAASSR
ncbi:MAG: dipeptidase [Bryobacteraceae bacterium]|nr:dipeptidase [Bryobacteraceae bacterium]